jgi:hypothetical protein
MKYSLVIPVFNNSKGIQDLYLSIKSAFSNLININNSWSREEWTLLMNNHTADLYYVNSVS